MDSSTKPTEMQLNSVKNQYYATFCINIMTLSYGTSVGWASPNFLILQSNETPLESGPITDEEGSWITSILCIGGLIGNILFGWLSNQFGRKMSLILVAVPSLLSWIILIFAKNVIHLCISRFLSGFGGGGIFVVVPLYITEISEDRTRGSLGSFLVFSANIGLLLAFVLGNYFSYYVNLYILIGLPVIFLISTIKLPETPQHLLKNKKEKEAENSLRYFRNIKRVSSQPDPPEIIKTELEKLKQNYLEEDKGCSDNYDNSLSWKDFTNRAARKACIIGIVLMALNQFCGCFAMINYTATIFKQAGSNLSPNMSAIIIGALQIIGCLFSTLLVERAGRKFLLTLSALGTGLGLFTFGLYTYMEGIGYNLSNFRWIPLASFSFVIFIASWGVLTLPFLVVSEILPTKIRSFVSVWCMNLLWASGFLMIKFYPILANSIGMSTCLFIFSMCSLSGAIFIMACVPETKGKSLETILLLLSK